MPAFKAPAPGFAVRFSPFHENRLLAAASQHFGLVGNGHLLVLDLAASGPSAAPVPVFTFPTSDALFDCAWSESHESLCAAASGDGSVRLFDAALPPAQNPVRLLREHAREVHGLDWNPVRRDAFVSASWDDTVKLWSPDRPASVRTFRGHEYCVYAAAWSARHPDIFASASGDRTARVWDVRDPAPTLVIPAHDHEVLSLDWDKYDPSILATASVDKSIRVWDVRAPRAPLAQLAGHGYAVKRVRFSPHRQGMLMSCSYDMTVCMWDYRAEDALVARYAHHTEFVAGIDMSVLVEGLLASAGWDDMIYVWPFGTDPRAMMSQTQVLHWCSAYHAAPPADEESEIVAQFLAAPYPYQNDDDQDLKQLGDIRTSSTYWPDHVTDPIAGACYWPSNADSSNGDSNAGSGGGYLDDDGCYYYLGEPDVSLGINTRATLPCTSIDLNLLGDGEEERSACVQPVPPNNPSPADHIRTGQLDGGNDGAAVSRPKRKVPAGRDGGDLERHKKKEKKASTSKMAHKCVQETTQSSGSCSGNESNCSEARVGGGNVKTRASKGSATDPQSLYARRRRERINERLKILQKLVPNGTKVDISTMLEEAVQYVRFLQLQIKMLSSDEMWMYAPIAYNGMSLGIDLISPPQ